MSTWFLAMDVDGTILTEADTVPAEVRQQIQLARANGVYTTLATARAPKSVVRIIEDIGGVDAAICFGGALTLTGDWESWALDGAEDENGIPAALLQDCIVHARKAGLSLAVYGARNVYVDRLNDTLRHQFDKTGLISVEGDLLTVTEPVLKVLAIADNGTLPALDELRSTFGEQLSCLYSHANFLEINHRSVSKGAAVDRLRQSLGISRENVVAIGDSENDLSMFAVAGMPIAMGNATNDVRSAARWVTQTNENSGVAVALRHCAETLWRD